MPENLLSPITGLSESALALATAIASDVLSGKTFYAGDKDIKTGSMTNRGAWTGSVAAGSSITIPAGYHNGSGKVTASSGSVSSTSETFTAQINGVNPLVFKTTKAAKVLILKGTSWGYDGTYLTFSGRGIINLVNGGHFSDHSYGRAGDTYNAAYGLNIPAGTSITLSGFATNQGANAYVTYIN